jgi:hypothetical protein
VKGDAEEVVPSFCLMDVSPPFLRCLGEG